MQEVDEDIKAEDTETEYTEAEFTKAEGTEAIKGIRAELAKIQTEARRVL